MKVWGIITTVLMLVFLGISIWMYSQNKDLKNKNVSANSELSITKVAKDQANAKIVAVSQKVEVLKLFFSGALDQEESLKMYNLINLINDATLSADWKAMQNSKQGDNSGNKMLQDLAAAMANDLK